jgi:hypothetical protein
MNYLLKCHESSSVEDRTSAVWWQNNRDENFATIIQPQTENGWWKFVLRIYNPSFGSTTASANKNICHWKLKGFPEKDIASMSWEK